MRCPVPASSTSSSLKFESVDVSSSEEICSERVSSAGVALGRGALIPSATGPGPHIPTRVLTSGSQRSTNLSGLANGPRTPYRMQMRRELEDAP